RKVSLTLSEDNWEWLDEKAEGNRSKFLREIVWNALGNESEWSNYAALGYAIAGAKRIGMNDDKTNDLIKAIYGEFDMKSDGEGEEIYRESDYLVGLCVKLKNGKRAIFSFAEYGFRYENHNGQNKRWQGFNVEIFQ